MTRAANGALRGAWAWLAWVALAMLVAQPAAAGIMPQPASHTVVVELCSAHSPGKTVAIELPGAPEKQAECGKCPSCLAAPAALEPASPESRSQAIAYETLRFSNDKAADAAFVRAPPRPPGQGPPAILNA